MSREGEEDKHHNINLTSNLTSILESWKHFPWQTINKSATMDVKVTSALSKYGYSNSMPTSTAITLERFKSLNIMRSLTNF